MSITITKEISEEKVLKAIENKDSIRKSKGKPSDFWKNLVVLDILGYDILIIKNSIEAGKLIEKEMKRNKELFDYVNNYFK